MKFKQKLQLFILSVSIVAFFLLIFIYFIVDKNNFNISENQKDQGFLEINDEKITFFLDDNSNQIKDTTENPCAPCIGKQVLIEINTDLGRDLVARNIEDGSVLELESTKVSSIWGYFPQEKLIIPFFSFNDQLEGEEIFIPVEKVGYELAGENANIEDLSVKELSKNNYENTMVLTKLVPVLNDFFNSDRQIWIVYYPNLESKTNYYISSSTINGNGSARMEISSLWHLLGNYSTLETTANYRIITPPN